MRIRFTSVTALIVFASVCPIACCEAQDAKPAKPKTDAPQAQPAQPVKPQEAPPAAFPAMPAMRLVPAQPIAARPSTGLPFDLANLVLAKFDDSPKGAQLLALVDQTRTEQRIIPVTAFKQEVRTRTIPVTGADGKPTTQEQTYMISVPFTENVERDVQVPAGKKPTAFPLNELQIYRLDGIRVSEAEARKQLEKMTPIFLLRGFTGDIKPVEGVYLQALNPNCLIVVTEKAE